MTRMATAHLEQRTTIASPIAATADLSTRAGIALSLRSGVARLGPSLFVEEDRIRRLAELAPVRVDPVGRHGRRVEYRMLNGVREADDIRLQGNPLRYELTIMGGRPIGSEAAKTFGHVHVRPAGAMLGYPEVVEVVHGEAGFLIQDLRASPDGPMSTAAWLVRARPGDWLILPPELAHVTIDLGAGPLVFSDVIDRRAAGLYSGVAEARGFAWYVGRDGRLWRNPHYVEVPRLIEVDAVEWSGPAAGTLYRTFRQDPDSFAWLSDPATFPSVAPALWQRVRDAIGAPHAGVGPGCAKGAIRP
jgi:glucose-6-phosphate isomerase, archaeal